MLSFTKKKIYIKIRKAATKLDRKEVLHKNLVFLVFCIFVQIKTHVGGAIEINRSIKYDIKSIMLTLKFMHL